jgi:hypothetical protein
MACAAGVGKSQASKPVRLARNPLPANLNSRSSRADKRAATPGVMVSASKERETSGFILRAYI